MKVANTIQDKLDVAGYVPLVTKLLLTKITEVIENDYLVVDGREYLEVEGHRFAVSVRKAEYSLVLITFTRDVMSKKGKIITAGTKMLVAE